MSENHVVVQFLGICTHIKMKPEAADSPHRVILPNAGPDQVKHDVLRRQNVQAHVAKLEIRKGDIDKPERWPEEFEPAEHEKTWVWTLDGITLSIGNAVIPQKSNPDGAVGLPRLNDYCCRPAILRAECFADNATANRDVTSCFFDFHDLTPVAMPSSEGVEGLRATITRATVSTGSNAPILSVQHFGASDSLSLSIRSEALITVSSFPDDPASVSDKDADFLLHFLSTDEVPAKSWFPPAPPWKQCDGPPADEATGAMTGPGCSNSIYP